jgi:hypothetical protein
LAIEAAIWIYWGFCLIAATLIMANWQLVQTLLSLDPNISEKNTGFTLSLSLGWIATLLASTVYVLFTVKTEMGSYNLSDLITFSLINGVFEQSMFIFWFLVGCYVGQKLFPKHPIRIFFGILHLLYLLRADSCLFLGTSVAVPRAVCSYGFNSALYVAVLDVVILEVSSDCFNPLYACCD